MSEVQHNLAWLIQFYKPLRKRLAMIGIMSIIVASISATIPYIYIQIIDGIKSSINSAFLFKSIGILLILGVSNFFFSALNASKRAQTNLDLEWGFRQYIFSKLIHLDQKFYEKFRTGDMVTRLTDDVGKKLSWFACSGIFRAWESTLRTTFCLIAMFMINPKLTLIALVPFPIQLLLYITSTRILDRRFKMLQNVISRVNDTIEACFTGIRIVQAYCMEKREALKFSEIAHERASAEIRAEKSHIFVHSLYGYFWQLSQVIILLAGGMMVIQDTLTVGEFVAFDYYIGFLVWPMFDIGGLLVGYRRAAVSIERLREIDRYAPAITHPQNATEPKNSKGHIIFNDVSVRRGDRMVLHDISFDSENHNMIAVVGEIGSGKSTVLSLIARFIDPDSGKVCFDGVPLPDFPLSGLRSKIGYVAQEPLLFTDTIRNNIRFGREIITDKSILKSADVAQLTKELSVFKQGLETPVGLRGMMVSGGQKQRISIARALAGNPLILLLDDATAHLDAETESNLWNVLTTGFPSTRVFVVSHRTATLERADLILVLKNGRLVEQGRHHDLLAQMGEYHRIYSRRKMEEYIRGNHVLTSG